MASNVGLRKIIHLISLVTRDGWDSWKDRKSEREKMNGSNIGNGEAIGTVIIGSAYTPIRGYFAFSSHHGL